LNPARNAVDIFNEKKENDLVFVFVHDGRMHIPVPSDRVIENYRAFIDAGASIIVGHHPHIYQGYEYYNGGAIFYSLGNFLFPPIKDTNSDKANDWCQTYSIKAYFDKQGIIKSEIIPHKFDISEKKLSKLKGKDSVNFFRKLDKLNLLLKDKEKNRAFFTDKALEFKYYDRIIDRIISAYGKAVSEPGDDTKSLRLASEKFYRHLKTEEHIDVLLATSRYRSL
jgi:poly-gamma-glutamate synthesis protein (capsule biosynthesis protein)